ncbi:MAG: heat-shock protein [Rhodospirillales bacterium 20-60-12]|nr:MAG: heat-shock protein [Rhodospirillales bacterium 20-60-12]HQT66563.1 Hsp20 family protein [Acetobacteraceae bacterium]HQU01994.1 Hsp20 family protein [Acetobacteraceae bacterium]
MTIDFTPLFRSAIGFDRLANILDSVPDAAVASYPPYNIEKTGDDAYRVTMAVAGFGQDDLDLTVKDNTLIVTGRVAAPAQKVETLHRGIAARAFERRFALADHMVVEGAELVNGLLHIALKRIVPEALKPRRVLINAVNHSTPTLTAQAA